ncbi:MAG TPA: hypothetical protein VGH33_03305 [Isosphaeraceae bacterium]|jgi:hypothetical protein
MPGNDILPADGLPATEYPAGATVEWLLGDYAAGFRQRGGHPVYGEHDVLYRFNRLGYRGAEFDAEAEVRVIAVGCSYVLGVGLAQQDIFHERFAQRLRAELSKSVVLLNLGRAGASNDYIARILQLAVARLDPHVVLTNFTHAARREYVSVQNDLVTYNPVMWPGDAVSRDIYGHLAALTSAYDDRLNLFRNYKSAEALLAGRCWLYSHIKQEEIEPVAAHIDRRRYVGILRPLDLARDGLHPGPASHENLAGLYWDRFVEIGGPAALSGGAS